MYLLDANFGACIYFSHGCVIMFNTIKRLFLAIGSVSLPSFFGFRDYSIVNKDTGEELIHAFNRLRTRLDPATPLDSKVNVYELTFVTQIETMLSLSQSAADINMSHAGKQRNAMLCAMLVSAYVLLTIGVLSAIACFFVAMFVLSNSKPLPRAQVTIHFSSGDMLNLLISKKSLEDLYDDIEIESDTSYLKVESHYQRDLTDIEYNWLASRKLFAVRLVPVFIMGIIGTLVGMFFLPELPQISHLQTLLISYSNIPHDFSIMIGSGLIAAIATLPLSYYFIRPKYHRIS